MTKIILHVLIMLALPPLLLGVINKVKSWFGGRVGPPVLQTYFDIMKLLRKGMVFGATTTWIFRAGPIVTLASVTMAGLFVPIGALDSPIAFSGDLIFFAYLLGLARFFTTSAALDTGSAFEGMGAAREVTFATLTEPALFFALLVLARISGSLTLSDMLHGAGSGYSHAGTAPLVLVAVGLFTILLAEACRIPVDDPNTHLELTMIHEVMVLDHSGGLLGIILYSAAIKMFILGAVLLHVIAPIRPASLPLDLLLFIFEIIGLAAVVGVVESVMARLRMKHVPHLLIGAILCCGFGFLLLVRFPR